MPPVSHIATFLVSSHISITYSTIQPPTIYQTYTATCPMPTASHRASYLHSSMSDQAVIYVISHALPNIHGLYECNYNLLDVISVYSLNPGKLLGHFYYKCLISVACFPGCQQRIHFNSGIPVSNTYNFLGNTTTTHRQRSYWFSVNITNQHI